MIIFASQICNVIYNVADDQIASRAQRERRLFLLDIVDSCLDIFNLINDLTWICLIYPPLYRITERELELTRDFTQTHFRFLWFCGRRGGSAEKQLLSTSKKAPSRVLESIAYAIENAGSLARRKEQKPLRGVRACGTKKAGSLARREEQNPFVQNVPGPKKFWNPSISFLKRHFQLLLGQINIETYKVLTHEKFWRNGVTKQNRYWIW